MAAGTSFLESPASGKFVPWHIVGVEMEWNKRVCLMLDCLYCPFQHVVLECQGQMVLKGFLYAWPWWGDNCLDSLRIFLVLALEDQN